MILAALSGVIAVVLLIRIRPAAPMTNSIDLEPTSAAAAYQAYPPPVYPPPDSDLATTATVVEPVFTTTSGLVGYISPDIAARSNYRRWLSSFTDQQLASVGLVRETASRTVSLGEPISVHYHCLNILAAYEPATFGYASLYSEVTSYEYPVMHQNRGVGSLTVYYREGAWISSGLGGPGFATQVGMLQQAYGAPLRGAKLLIFQPGSIRVLVLDRQPAAAVLLSRGKSPYLDDIEQLDLNRSNVPIYPLEVILARLRDAEHQLVRNLSLSTLLCRSR
jgi:hypothetical protein